VDLRTCRSREKLLATMSKFAALTVEKLPGNFTTKHPVFLHELEKGGIVFVSGFDEQRHLNGKPRAVPLARQVVGGGSISSNKKDSARAAVVKTEGGWGALTSPATLASCPVPRDAHKSQEDEERMARMQGTLQKAREDLQACKALFKEHEKSIHQLVLSLHRANPNARVQDALHSNDVYNNYLHVALAASAKADTEKGRTKSLLPEVSCIKGTVKHKVNKQGRMRPTHSVPDSKRHCSVGAAGHPTYLGGMYSKPR